MQSFDEALNWKEWNGTPIKMQVYDEREENNRREKTYITKFDRFLRARSVHHCCCEWKMWSRVYIESPFFTLWKNSILLPWKELKEVQTETIIHCYCTQDQLEINTMKRYSFLWFYPSINPSKDSQTVVSGGLGPPLHWMSRILDRSLIMAFQGVPRTAKLFRRIRVVPNSMGSNRHREPRAPLFSPMLRTTDKLGTIPNPNLHVIYLFRILISLLK